ncbi:Type I phosphodiesterase / nucleotide pyrophosphatase [Adhaeretor mobilis]|uniref:Type I phosphodiesterase / nucleotide pyrophosphatase n=2 Tax=Adhaeretor mobilis TaxID=1930276 RepID=A0A517MXQ2_9BACT|nr:Type I phosphodiesterase / nucleotide pyrophosphatase [Adhaeretor mobilis]
MPLLSKLVDGGDRATLAASLPAVTCPVQANMTTGTPPSEHGVVANGFYWRESDSPKRGTVEMWTAANDCIERPQLWDVLHEQDSQLTSAVWFPLHSKQCGADYVCTPAPIHNPDGSESLWCYTKPEALYGELRDEFGHFPLHHFWGPTAGIASTAWIVSSAIHAAKQYKPNLFYVYVPHLDYAAQKHGPDSEQAIAALGELDNEIGRLVEGFADAYSHENPLWLVASEYVITPVNNVSYPNRALREAGLLKVCDSEHGGVIDYAASDAWALVDHQFSHVFLSESADQDHIAELLRSLSGVADVFAPAERAEYDLNHQRSGDLVVVSHPDSWQAYYWWDDDEKAPTFARTVDIHRKPGYDPVELFFDAEKKCIPLDATLVKGSHGAPAMEDAQRGVLLCSQKGVFVERPLADIDVADIVLRQFGI